MGLYGEPVSPQSRVFLRQEMDFSIDSFVCFENPIDVVTLKAALSSSLIRNCPKLRSIVVTEEDGRQRWSELPDLDIDNHVIIVPEEDNKNNDDTIYINEYLASLSSLAPLKRGAPLWEVHVLPRKRRSMVLRFHHALGDCVSLLALFLATCDPSKELLAAEKEKPIAPLAARVWKRVTGVWAAVKAARFSPAYWMEHYMLSTRRYKDGKFISSEESLELFPRKLASVTLSLDDMKAVKNKLNATINDVFVGVVSCGIAKYLDLKSQDDGTSDLGALRGLVAVNLRGEGSKDLQRSIRGGKEIKWGNKLGYFVMPIHLKKRTDDPLNCVREAKTVLDHKKNTFEAQFSHRSNATVISLYGLKVMASMSHTFRHNMDLFLSNIVGPSQPIKFADNLVTRIGVTLNSLPAALDVHMISYNGEAFLQVLVAQKVIPDPEQLCMCIQDALKEMKAML